MNQFRAAFNAHFQNYELILEDDWYKDEGRTTIEYDLRCLDTKEFCVLAQDSYASHQDAKGVWHLGDYQHTEWLVPASDVWEIITVFIANNTPLKLALMGESFFGAFEQIGGDGRKRILAQGN